MLSPLLALVALAALLPLAQEKRPELHNDQVHLRDGTVLSGQVTYEDDLRLGLRNNSKDSWVERDTIELVDSRVRNLSELMARLELLGPPLLRPADGLLELASYAQHARLPGEAALLATEALLADPSLEAAAELAGARQRRDRWELNFGGRRQRLDQLLEGGRPWKQRVLIDTAHHRLATNLPLDQAIAAAVDTERLTLAYMQAFAHDLTLLQPSEFMLLNLHADPASFPQPGSGRLGAFDALDRIARAEVSRPPWREQVVHESVRQLNFFLTQRVANARGQFPLWVDVGLAEAFAASVTGPLGQSRFDPTAVDRRRFVLQARAERPLQLERVLVLSDEDLDSHQDQALKYAQCYTLVHFLLYGDDETRRDAFLQWLRAALDGKGSPSKLKKALGGNLDHLDHAWNEYVQRLAAA